MESYMDTLAEFLNKEQLQFVKDLFEWLMQPCLGLYIDNHCQSDRNI